MCKDCAEYHKAVGGMSQSYVKDVYSEHWDDYQLRSVCYGGNQALFQIMKEYGCDNNPVTTKYKHSCVQWYQKRHVALMDGIAFDLQKNPKPPRDMKERAQ